MIKKFKLFESDILYKPSNSYSREENVPMSKKHITYFRNLLSKYYMFEYESGGPVLKLTTKTSSMAPSIDIRELKDEWFYVGFWYRDTNGQLKKSIFYRCDQTHGVEKLLKDKFVI